MLASRQGAIRESAWIDYLLTAVLGSLALFTIGQGIAQPMVGAITGLIYVFGTGFSFVVAMRLRATPYAAADSIVYAAAAGLAVFAQPALNSLLPPDSFPIELRSAGVVTWLLCLGSFAAWRDATRLFQAVPALALFGLVGVYDTYSSASFLFFGYLLCLALMFGRAHARSMLYQATRSGFARIEEGVSLSERGADQDSVLRAMRRGPWRWMAGPEWAVASAGAVILVSLFGAPILHDSVGTVAANIKLNMPSRMTAVRGQAAALTTESLKRIGTGPRHLYHTQVGLATLDKLRYLRTAVYDVYGSTGWLTAPEQVQAHEGPAPDEDMLAGIERPRTFAFSVDITDPMSGRNLPVPLTVNHVSDPPGSEILPDGTVRVNGNFVSGTAVESEVELTPTAPVGFQTSRRLGSEYMVRGVLQDFAEQVTAGSKTDLEKANRIMAAIANHAKYNLKAAAVPRDADPIEYFLFSSHEGYCDLFASAMVVLARDAGLDARYAIGYLPSADDRDAYGRYVLRQSDAHAWAEVYFKGVGWVVFDPTSMAEDITPSEAAGGSVWANVIPVGFGLALLAALVYYGPRLKMRAGLGKSTMLQRQLATEYGRFALELGRRARLKRPNAATPDGWLASTRAALGGATARAEELTAEFVSAMYANVPLTEERLARLHQEVKEFRKLKS